MSELDENWQKENLEKSKEVLKEHFNLREQERMMKDMIRISPTPLHYSTIDWAIDESDFDDFSEKKDAFFEDLIWNPPYDFDKEGSERIERRKFKRRD